MSKEDGTALLNEFLDVDIEDAYDECENLKGAHILLS